MRRVGLRALMATIGVGLLAFHLGAAYVGYRLLIAAWIDRPDLTTTAAIVVGLTLLFGYLSYRYGTASVIASLDAVPLTRERAPSTHDALDRLCERMGVRRPTVLVARMDSPNALSLGGARGGVIVVDVRLFRLLDPDELEGVLAHELAHLDGYDALVQTLAYSAVETVIGLALLASLPVAVLATGIAHGVAWIRGRPKPWAIGSLGGVHRRLGQAATLLLVAMTALIRAHSRRREYAADDRAVAATDDPIALAHALAKIDRATRPRWRLTAPLYVRGDEAGRLSRLLSTHPSMDDRIDRLVGRAARERSIRSRRPGEAARGRKE